MNQHWCRLIFESFPEPMVIADGNGNVMEWNSAAEELFGLPAHGQPGMVTPGATLAGFLPPNAGPCRFQASQIAANGKERRIEYSILPLDAAELPGTVLLHARDISERARYEEGLLAIGQKFRHLNADIRHDILNQLTILIGFLQFSEDLATDDKFREFIGKEITAGEKVQRLIEFTREYQDIGEQGPRWLECTAALGKVVHEIGEDKVTLTPLPDFWEIYAHPSVEAAIERLVLYVVGERRPTVPAKIFAAEDPDGLNIIVEDYASPVPPDEKDLLFERGHGQAGIDLWLVKELLSLSEISIQEKGDTGGRFVMTVPGRLVRKKG